MFQGHRLFLNAEEMLWEKWLESEKRINCNIKNRNNRELERRSAQGRAADTLTQRAAPKEGKASGKMLALISRKV